MELAKKRRKTIVVVLSIVIGFIVYHISMCVFAEYILNQGVNAWHGFALPIAMALAFIPIALGEIALLRFLKKKGKKYVILNFIFGLHLIGFPIGIVVMIIYNIVVGIK